MAATAISATTMMYSVMPCPAWRPLVARAARPAWRCSGTMRSVFMSLSCACVDGARRFIGAGARREHSTQCLALRTSLDDRRTTCDSRETEEGRAGFRLPKKERPAFAGLWPHPGPSRSGDGPSTDRPRSGGLLRAGLGVEELRVLGRALERRGRRFALDGGRHGIEVAGADLALVLDRGEAALGRRELGFLQLDERAHLLARIAMGQVEHAVVQRVEAGQRDELEL